MFFFSLSLRKAAYSTVETRGGLSFVVMRSKRNVECVGVVFSACAPYELLET